MNMKTYRKVLAHQGIGSLMLLGLFSKIAVVAIPVVLNLAVVLGLDRGFGAAGLVITAWTVGVGIGGYQPGAHAVKLEAVRTVAEDVAERRAVAQDRTEVERIPACVLRPK